MNLVTLDHLLCGEDLKKFRQLRRHAAFGNGLMMLLVSFVVIICITIVMLPQGKFGKGWMLAFILICGGSMVFLLSGIMAKKQRLFHDFIKLKEQTGKPMVAFATDLRKELLGKLRKHVHHSFQAVKMFKMQTEGVTLFEIYTADSRTRLRLIQVATLTVTGSRKEVAYWEAGNDYPIKTSENGPVQCLSSLRDLLLQRNAEHMT